MDPESSHASHLPWIWFLESLASNKEVDYLTLRDVARKVPGLSGSDALHARELLALRCLEGLAEMGNEDMAAPRCGSKIGLDMSQRCSVALFRVTSEAVNSSSGLDGLDVSNWDIQSFVMHKRAQLPKCTLERLEEMIVAGNDPTAVSLREISGIKIIDHRGHMDTYEGVTKGVSSPCDRASRRQVAAGSEEIINSIPQDENENENEKGSCQDSIKDVLLQKALTGEGCFLKKDGDVRLNLKKSTEDNHVGDDRPLVVHDNGDRVPVQLTSPPKEDGSESSDSGKKPQYKDIVIEHYSKQMRHDDQDVHTLRDNRKLSSDISQVVAAQTVLGEDFTEEIKSPAERDAPITAKCNQQQAVLPVVINRTNSDRNENVDGGPVCVSVVKASRDDLGNEREPYKVGDNPCNGEGCHNEEVDVASCKNNFLSSQCTTFDDTEPSLCMKCNKSGPLLCCNSSVCSIAVHGDCLGAAPCFDDSGSFCCPFCVSSLATAEYLDAKSKADIRKKELNVYIASISSAFPQIVLNRKKKRHLNQVDPSYPMKSHGNEEKAERNRKQAKQNVEQGVHTSPEIVGDVDVNPTHETPGLCVNSDLLGRVINNEDILPPRGRNTTTNNTTCQPRDAFAQPPLPSEGFEQQDSAAIVLYEGDKGSDKRDTVSQNPPESKIKHVKPVPNIPNTMISKPTLSVPYQSYPAHRKRKVPWTAEEEDKLKEGVRRFYNPEAGGYIPWGQILEFGALVFQPRRTAENLKDKWRNICKKEG